MSMIGKTLGNFQCTALLGKGGMGEVYKAKDQKLGRDVAIKVLPEEFAKDADRVARFQREAKLLASLNHPNIAAIHGLEESDGTHFLVLELIEGDTLADQIKKSPLPAEESLEFALQIAEALEAAHEKGVIHRDLKPANIKVTPDGKVKVLDFGLAKAFAGEHEEVNLSHSPTLSDMATQQGLILGTAAYMSPEQARGKPVDKRTDIWAFGCVLYEMLTGKAAFQGEDVTEILAAVVKSGVNLDLLPANIHTRVREVIIRCLQKDIKNRYRDIGDARFEIRQVLSDPNGVFVHPVATTKHRKRLRLGIPWVAAALILGLIIAGVAVWYLKPTPEKTITRFPVIVPEGDVIPYTEGGVAISPDGSKIVFAAVRSGARQLYLRKRDQVEPIPIANTENATHPFFSPDGEWIGFFTGSELKKISLSGGSAQTLSSATYRLGASWGPDKSIIFACNDSPGLMQVSASGGEPRSITSPDAGMIHKWPEFLPDGKAVLFTIMGPSSGLSGLSSGKVAVFSLETGKYEVLVDGVDAHYAPSGHLVFGRQRSLWAAPFDVKNRKLTGDPALVQDNVQVNSGGWALYDLADDGTLVYMLGTDETRSLIPVWVNREGKEESIAAQPNSGYINPILSPDESQVAIQTRTEGNTDIQIFDFVRNTMLRLTDNEAMDVKPLWTPNGKRIVFASNRDGNFGIYWKASNDTGDVETLLTLSDRMMYPASWSADGNTLVLMEDSNANLDVGVVSLEGEHEHKLLLHEDYNETQPKVSPDGRWMAYQSDESGRYEIYLRPFPDVESDKRTVSIHGGTEPKWSPNGQELFYRSRDSIMSVALKTEPTLILETPKPLFNGILSLSLLDTTSYWDVGKNGKAFLIIKESDKETSSEGRLSQGIDVVLNWFEELKERVPAP